MWVQRMKSNSAAGTMTEHGSPPKAQSTSSMRSVSTPSSRVVTAATKDEMRTILTEIQSGEFAREWMDEYKAGAPNLKAARDSIANHPVEETGRRLRDMMTFLVAKTPQDDV